MVSGSDLASADGDKPNARVDPALPVSSVDPSEPLDGRVPGTWRTRYTDPLARKQIIVEAAYLIIAIAAAYGTISALALEWPRPALGVTSERWVELAPYGYSIAGGFLGGSLFSAKWLIHTIARGTWNQDRIGWRFFTPWIGAGAGFLVVALSISRLVPLFDSDLVRSGAGSTGVALLVGFFADRTFSRLEGFASGGTNPTSGQS